jgi:secreted PhoX family phosphatase
MNQTVVKADELENEPVNPSTNPQFTDIVAEAQSRRRFLKAGAGAAALAFVGCATPRGDAVPAAGPVTLGFGSVPLAGNDTVVVPAGYKVQVLYAWGDPIGKAGVAPGTPAWSGDASEGAAEQELQAGMHHDGMHFFPFPAGAGLSSTHGLLAMNHEYTDQGLLFPDGTANWGPAKVRKSQAAHGVSVIEVRRNAAGAWEVVRPSTHARRVTATTPMRVGGPAASVIGTAARGTLNNCAHGTTPWGTYLACEENFNGYFGATRRDASGQASSDSAFVPNALEARYGLRATGFGYDWHQHDPRFDLNTAEGRAEANRFGWVVEVDPFNPDRPPVKRTALGRIKHEGAVHTLAKDGRVVIYTGDDQAGEYIYKFVSKGRYDAARRAANADLLDEGTLYVARFDAGATAGDNLGSGEWLELSLANPAIAPHFSSLGEMLVNTRRAADLAGATRMDRPEWIAVNPAAAGQVYCTLTNNSGRTTADDANPRTNNRYGHIIRWSERGGDPAATRFDWDIFVLAGDRDLAANAGTPHAGNIRGDSFGSPDGLWFDGTGRLWIQTDISSAALGTGTGAGGYANMPNNMMLAANVATGEVRRFLTGPKGCEVTGMTSTPDGRTFFVNVQHPGEGASDGSNPADPQYPVKVSRWPANQGHGFRDDGSTPKAKLRPRSATVVITRSDGGVVGA